MAGINQANVEEKSHQVGVMGHIFANAGVVLVALGAHVDGSETLIPMLREFHENAEFFFPLDVPTLNYVDQALYSFTHREYWQRVWIIQELCVARAIQVLCGNDIVDWTVFTRVWEFGHEIYKRYRKFHCGTPAKFDVFDSPLYVVIETVGIKTLSLERIVTTFNSWVCTHPLDRIYGFLHIIQWPETSSALRPDYSKSAYELMLDCMDHLIWQNKAVSEGARSPWYVLTDLWASLHLNDDDEYLRASLEQRQSQRDRTWKRNSRMRDESRSFGFRLETRPLVCGKFRFDAWSRLQRFDERSFICRRAGHVIFAHLRYSGPLYSNAHGLEDTLRDALICEDAQDGDFLLQPEIVSPGQYGYLLLLVARELPGLDVCEIIGYAVIAGSWFHRAYVSSDESWVPPQVVDQSFEGVFCKEDMIAYTSFWAVSRDESSGRIMPHVLTTRFTGHRFSSFIITHRPQNDDGANPAISGRRGSWAGCGSVSRPTDGAKSRRASWSNHRRSRPHEDRLPFNWTDALAAEAFLD